MVVNSLYRNAEIDSDFLFDQRVLQAALKRIYDTNFNPMTDIEENLFNEYWAKLNEAAGIGFSIPTVGTRDFNFFGELKSNNAVFAAFKTHRLQNDMAALMLDEKGELKPFSSWMRDVTPIADHQNKNWFATEYNTCVKRAHQAAEWKQYEAEANILPNLRWMPSTAVSPRASHMVFWNRVWPINSPFWSQHRPGDAWGCLCNLSSTDDPTTDNSDLKESMLPQHAPGLRGNPGITAEIFSGDHPYITNSYKGAQEAVDSFIDNLKRPFKPYKSYNNGGELLVHFDVDKLKTDYKPLIAIGNSFAKAGHKVKLTPRVNYKNGKYKDVYGSLIGTKYERKCPDLSIDGVFYEYESFKRPWKKSKVGAMLSHGLKQSDHIIIDNTKGCRDRYIRRIIHIQSKQTAVAEVWIYESGKVRLLYKKQGGR